MEITENNIKDRRQYGWICIFFVKLSSVANFLEFLSGLSYYRLIREIL